MLRILVLNNNQEDGYLIVNILHWHTYLILAASGTLWSSSLNVATLGYFFSRTVMM